MYDLPVLWGGSKPHPMQRWGGRAACRTVSYIGQVQAMTEHSVITKEEKQTTV